MMSELFFDSLIDDFGIWQHSDGRHVLRSSGYALDDAARGLLLCLTTDRLAEAQILFSYIIKAQKNADFFGFATSKHRFYNFPSSEDAKGEAIWSLGYAFSKNFRPAEAKKSLELTAKNLLGMKHVRGYAYSLLGFLYSDLNLALQITKRLVEIFKSTNGGWPWPEEQLTYGNAIVPYALLRSSLVLGNKQAGALGNQVLQFIEEACTHDRQLGPIGNQNWLKKGQVRAPDYSQQPIDAAYMVWAWLAAYQLDRKKIALARANRWLEWFEGNNIVQKRMYNPANLQCFDGIDDKGINYHSGAESNICFPLTQGLMQRMNAI